jgi:hypothetical protein
MMLGLITAIILFAIGAHLFRAVSVPVFVLLVAPFLVCMLVLVWVFLLPVPIPVPPLHSPLLDALERSNATIRAVDAHNPTANPEDIAGLLAKGLTTKNAESFLRNERFYCGPFQDMGAREARRWGEKYRHYKVCKRLTYFHPLGSGGWEIRLFVDRNDMLESVNASRYYDGV